MIEFIGFSHLSIIVDNLDEAMDFYKRIFNAKPFQRWNCKNNKGVGYIVGCFDTPEKVDISLGFVRIPDSSVVLELQEYHYPESTNEVTFAKVNDLGGIRHVSLLVKDSPAAFDFLKNQEGILQINESEKEKCASFQISNVNPDDVLFYDDELENDKEAKQRKCDQFSETFTFYCIDKYGVQWEFEQGDSSRELS